MSLYFSSELSGSLIKLSPEESSHCIRVMRQKVGDIVHVTDGKGVLCKARILQANDRKCELAPIERHSQKKRSDSYLHIAVAPTKNIRRFEWFLEKATEIGIDEITPLLCEHSERKTLNIARMNIILVAAMKQSQQTFLPKLNPLVEINEFICRVKEACRDETRSRPYLNHIKKFIAFYNENNPDLAILIKRAENALILIGPEGDFTEGEKKLSETSGFNPVNLGYTRLRTETAALAACHTVSLINRI